MSDRPRPDRSRAGEPPERPPASTESPTEQPADRHAAVRSFEQRLHRMLARQRQLGHCPRCWLPASERRCEWCGHDAEDAEALRALSERHVAAWRTRAERRHRGGTMTCPACGQWSGSSVMCQWCDFDATDEQALAARRAYGEHQLERQRVRRRRFLDRVRTSGRRSSDGHVSAFMTCPACHQWSSSPVCDWCDFDASDDEAVMHLTEQHRFAARRWQRRRGQAYAALRGLMRIDLMEHARLAGHLAKWIVLGALVGLLAGLASAGFLVSLEWATETRESHPWLLWLLPLAGLAIGLVYHYGGHRAAAGNNLIIDEIHEPRAWIPRRMAPLVYAGTVVTHLFGGSAGREGTAIQMSGSLTDAASRVVHLDAADRRIMLIAAIAGGFGAVFGVPLAGCVFALEVQAVGRVRYDAIVPALTASVIGDMVVRGLGVHHTATPAITGVDLSPALLAKVAVAGLLFGLTSVVFSELTHGIRRAFGATVRWAPLRPFIGGLMVVGLTYVVGTRDYLGLSIPLITGSLAGGLGIVAFAFAFKLLFTSVTLGSGFQGGEVTPLFVIGATLGATLGHLLGVPVEVMAAIGFVAVFAGATNTPLACTVMAAELFGSEALVLFAVACVVSYVFSSHRGIYGTQRVDTPKGDGLDGPGELTLAGIAKQRRHWLPARPPEPPSEATA